MLLATRRRWLLSARACHLPKRWVGNRFGCFNSHLELHILIWFANVFHKMYIVQARGLHKLFVLQVFLYAENHTTVGPLCSWIKEREWKGIGSGTLQESSMRGLFLSDQPNGKMVCMVWPKFVFLFSHQRGDARHYPGNERADGVGTSSFEICLVLWIKR